MKNLPILKTVIAIIIIIPILIFLSLHLYSRITIKGYAKKIASAPVDYSSAQNWLSLKGASSQKAVDVFFLYPTCYFINEVDFCPVDDPDMRKEAQKIRDAHIGIFEQANFYAPYYRQLSIPFIEKLTILMLLDQAIDAVPLQDAKNAFEYYLQHYNKGKPIIFASHSQGSIVMKELLLWIKKEHPEILDRTVAAYLIGFPVNENYLKKLGLEFAKGADDTRVVISYNTESTTAKYNPFIFMRRGNISINPINWKRDETYASKQESLGSFVRFGDNPPVNRFNFADARLNLKRGTVISNAEILDDFWSEGVLHRYDYDLFYYDLQHNISTRIASYLKK